MPHPKYTSEEIALRGLDLYDRQIRPQVERTHQGEFLALDIETGDYETDTDEVAAVRRARAKHPDAALYILRIGAPAAYRIGATHPATIS